MSKFNEYMNKSKQNEYVESTPADKGTDLLSLQHIISKTIDNKGVTETLYAIAIGLENSSKARELDEVINFILNNK